ncbi:MAG: hypothetical protein ACWGHO_05095 [Candidatus Moraniibacteriota bacterium]
MKMLAGLGKIEIAGIIIALFLLGSYIAYSGAKHSQSANVSKRLLTYEVITYGQDVNGKIIMKKVK